MENDHKNFGSDKPDDSEAPTKSDRPWWTEAVKEVTLTGLATIFMTEESVRSYLKEKKMPKELVSLVLESITKRKDDFYGLLAKEFGRVLSRIDLSKELSKFLETHEADIKVTFRKKNGGEQT